MTEKILGRDEINEIDDHELIPVEVPEWKGTVLVKPLTGDERDAYESSNYRPNPKTGQMEINTRGARARLAAMGLVDESGNRLYDPKNRRDLRLLGAKSSHALDRITEAIRDASGIDESYMESAVEDFDEAEDEHAGEALSSV